MTETGSRSILEIEGLGVSMPGESDPSLSGISLSLDRSEILTVLGREGAGGATLAAVLAGLPPRGAALSGFVTFGTLEGGKPARVAYLPSPVGTLAAHASVAGQLTRALAARQRIPMGSASEELSLALKRLEGAPAFEKLRARAPRLAPADIAFGLLALALVQQPDVVVADDPAFGLDPREAQTLVGLLMAQQARTPFALVYVTGDPGIAVQLGGRVAVLRDGRLIEEGQAAKLASRSAHPYTQGLFRSVLKLDLAAPTRPLPRAEPLLQIRSFAFSRPKKFDPATGITFDLGRGAGLALVGERGSGRRALVRAVMGLEPLRHGRIVFDSVDVGTLSATMRAMLRRRVVYITGEGDVLDPRMSVRDTVSEPLRSHLSLGAAQNEQAMTAALKRVGLGDLARGRLPGALDTLDRRRLQIARAIAATPGLAVLYEPLAGLDAPSAAVILDLLRDYRARSGVAFLLITANFAVAQALTDEVIVLKDRAVVERGAVGDVVKNPRDPYTKALIAAVVPVRRAALPPEGPKG